MSPSTSSLNGLRRVALLKQIDALTKDEFTANYLSERDSHVRSKIERVVFESNLAGIEEFSDEWYTVIRAKMHRMQLCRDLTVSVMNEMGDDTGFSAFERTMIVGCAKISGLYDAYYIAYLQSVQEPSITAKIAASPPTDKACYSHYTIVLHNDTDGYYTTSFAKHFENSLLPILGAMDEMIEQMKALPNLSADEQKYIEFFEHYRLCHSSDGDAPTLEKLWADLDRKWMDTKGNIQVVHDIETGYGDPLRRKATPDFSLRFLDDTYASENATIRDIQNHMMEYFRGRDTQISREGLTALGNTMAGIYYIPFKTGISLQFSFSGQSIPNRVDIKVEKGVKIYFDAVETEARVNQNLLYIQKVFHDPNAVVAKYKPDAVEQLVWHVAAHEVGHAIYNLETVEESLGSPSVVTLLEEPRAELTAMFTLRLLYTKNVLTLPHLKECLAHFALDALRYFAKFKSEPLRPYIIFQIYAYGVYNRHGYLSLNEAGEVVIDDSKTVEVLDTFSQKYLEILDAEDAMNGQALESILAEMTVESDFVKHVVSKVFP